MSFEPFAPAVYQNRREKLRARMRQAGHKALLVSHAANRFYLSGFELSDSQCNESSGMLLIRVDGPDKLLTDPRFLDAARRLWPEDDIFIYAGQRFAQIREFLSKTHSGPIAFESRAMSVDTHGHLRESLDLAPTHGLVEELRRFKEPEELKRLELSCAVNERVMRAAPDVLLPGRSEGEIAWRLEQLFRDFGATELAFSPIVAVDANAALPHAEPGRDVVKDECMVLVDMGGRYAEYNSDQTRTFWVGNRPPDHFRKALELTQQAQAKAIKAIRPGLTFAEAYQAARGYFERFGVEKAFTHALGHGIGLETHEFPSLSPVAQGTLEPGMVVTVEPGLYYPEWGGIRWEHMVAVTEDGCRILGQGA
ncbi:Aminopeptidase YpdF [Fundidesulfovibrio magnetotacticus]|uniref:Aminopeptidase YpdF n=1 Tax=Fundidesulfovibrio magnetotacticus TaxID=2730080 RepID=A0A6V8LQ25_9BACT|nr:Xaa-Pro peptidase family protein [Fundidesulfovibrio magnetotacticus]GFK92661.1 Aminopeptidase YpdF [Fundidesulfovibrio magnetotacticus]